MAIDLSDYVDVAERIREFRAKYPNGSLQQRNLQFVEFAGKSWVVITAAAYRAPDDERPGVGTAWEQVPGRTPYTKDSELQNAETAAWGRAIVAALAADTTKIASAEDVRNRDAERQQPAPQSAPQQPAQSGRPIGPPPGRAQAWQQVWEASMDADPELDQEQRRIFIIGELKERGLDGSKTEDLLKLAEQFASQQPVTS